MERLHLIDLNEKELISKRALTFSPNTQFSLHKNITSQNNHLILLKYTSLLIPIPRTTELHPNAPCDVFPRKSSEVRSMIVSLFLVLVLRFFMLPKVCFMLTLSLELRFCAEYGIFLSSFPIDPFSGLPKNIHL